MSLEIGYALPGCSKNCLCRCSLTHFFVWCILFVFICSMCFRPESVHRCSLFTAPWNRWFWQHSKIAWIFYTKRKNEFLAHRMLYNGIWFQVVIDTISSSMKWKHRPKCKLFYQLYIFNTFHWQLICVGLIIGLLLNGRYLNVNRVYHYIFIYFIGNQCSENHMNPFIIITTFVLHVVSGLIERFFICCGKNASKSKHGWIIAKQLEKLNKLNVE